MPAISNVEPGSIFPSARFDSGQLVGFNSAHCRAIDIGGKRWGQADGRGQNLPLRGSRPFGNVEAGRVESVLGRLLHVGAGLLAAPLSSGKLRFNRLAHLAPEAVDDGHLAAVGAHQDLRLKELDGPPDDGPGLDAFVSRAWF